MRDCFPLYCQKPPAVSRDAYMLVTLTRLIQKLGGHYVGLAVDFMKNHSSEEEFIDLIYTIKSAMLQNIFLF